MLRENMSIFLGGEEGGGNQGMKNVDVDTEYINQLAVQPSLTYRREEKNKSSSVVDSSTSRPP